MISGTVDAFKQAVIPLELCNANGGTKQVLAVIDTGFDGYLVITPELAQECGYVFRESRTFELGNGSQVAIEVHDGAITWDGQVQNVAALVVGGSILVGMSQLVGHTLFIDVVDGGEVRIGKRSGNNPSP